MRNIVYSGSASSLKPHFHICVCFVDTSKWRDHLKCQLFIFKKILFIYLWLCWVFVSVRGLSLVAASGGHSSSRCVGLSLSRPLLLQSTGSRRATSVVVAHGPSCSAACGIFPDQGSNPCPLHWQADSQPLCHQGSPQLFIFNAVFLNLQPKEGHNILRTLRILQYEKLGFKPLQDSYGQRRRRKGREETPARPALAHRSSCFLLPREADPLPTTKLHVDITANSP